MIARDCFGLFPLVVHETRTQWHFQ